MGYMDFKIAGTAEGVNCMQMDTKTHGLPMAVLEEALDKGREGRLAILEEMNAVISEPRSELSMFAPRMVCMSIDVSKIGLVIGPGGKNIRGLQTDHDVSIDVEDDGTVRIFGKDAENVAKVCDIIADITRDVEVGEVITGKVVTVTEHAAYVEVIPGRDGRLHIGDMAWEHVNKVEDVVKVGDEIEVKVVEVDEEGKIRVSLKALLPRPEGSSGSSRGRESSDRRGRNDRRGGSDRSRGSSDRSSRGSSDSSSPARGKAYFRKKPEDR